MKHDHRAGSRLQEGFTLMELMTVIVVVSILALMVFSSVGSVRAKAERGKCVSNLQTLFTATSSYLLDHESWPQIPTDDVESADFAKAWIDTLTPYKIGPPNWHCATVQKSIGDPPDDPDNPRIDYLPGNFDARPSSPWRFPTHPWFIERADAHGDGNLLIFTNGQIHSISDLRAQK